MNFLWKSLPANVTSKWFLIWMSDKMGFPVASIFDVHLLAAKATEKSYSAVWVIPIIVHMQSVTRTTRFWINWCEFTLRQEGRWFIFSHGKKVREVCFKKSTQRQSQLYQLYFRTVLKAIKKQQQQKQHLLLPENNTSKKITENKK